MNCARLSYRKLKGKMVLYRVLDLCGATSIVVLKASIGLKPIVVLLWCPSVKVNVTQDENRNIIGWYDPIHLFWNLYWTSVSYSKCSNYDGSQGFCHNGGSCWVMSNGTSACACTNGAYGPRCEFSKGQYKPIGGNQNISHSENKTGNILKVRHKENLRV